MSRQAGRLGLLCIAAHLTGGVFGALETATFAGGCFWCTEADFDKVEGVVETVSGYAGGDTEDPTYYQVVGGNTGHAEVLQLKFDTDVVSYEDLVRYFWRTVDPTDAGGQFCDRGSSYRTAVYYHDEAQRAAAELTKSEAEEYLDEDIVTEIEPLDVFYPSKASEGHQNYHNTNSAHYNRYRRGCRRDDRLKEVWMEQWPCDEQCGVEFTGKDNGSGNGSDSKDKDNGSEDSNDIDSGLTGGSNQGNGSFESSPASLNRIFIPLLAATLCLM